MKQIGYLIIIIFLIISCDKNDDNPVECSESGNCDKCIIINSDLYNLTNTDNYTIQNITVNQDCLEIEFGSSGCDGNSWEIDLVDLGGISETAVPQRDLKLRLINIEECEAFITRTISFNLEPLQLGNYEAINLKIADYNGLIRYEY
ncbi:hypothetical protein [Gillisia limnaea]|uniref:Lipoprotein n=2 Tax=Gillisia TaxID=244698 RepID=H2BXX6_GILLR|nr:hypothetical protein [Gillisia limnaea]EHQ02139.1 hypothetical protein Gilli_1485 [Gillisia limnaea DSM 15749]